MKTFDSLNLAKPILAALADEGYETPTPIQAKAVAPAMAGRDVLGCAQTGTGKTAAFALPIIHRLMERPPTSRGRRRARVLVLSPTRELATQITDAFGAYARHTPIRATPIYGGVSQSRQEKALARGVDVIVATPGRLIDLLDQGIVDLGSIEILVLDEADRMLDMGFIKPIRRIASEVPAERQTLLFSATMAGEIVGLADSLLRDPVRVAVAPTAGAVPLIEQSVHMVGRSDKQALLERLLNDRTVERALVFTRTKHGADRVCKKLNRAGDHAAAIHANKSQSQRQRALAAFRTGDVRILVGTDVAARGLDIDNVTHVFNFDLPMEPEAYVHRVGRTGRAGAAGIAIAFCDPEERALLRAIQKLTGERIPVAGETPADSTRNGQSRRSVAREETKPRGGRSPKRTPRPEATFEPKASTRPKRMRLSDLSPAEGAERMEPRIERGDAATRTGGPKPGGSRRKKRSGAASGAGPRRGSRNGARRARRA